MLKNKSSLKFSLYAQLLQKYEVYKKKNKKVKGIEK